MVEVVAQHKQRLSEQQKAYQALEDEFRMALRIEASRYHELRECYDRVQGQVDGYQAATEAALRKEQKATHMVAELTAIVREQRGRLAELGRAKQDSVQELKERVSELEAGVKEKHKLEVKVQSLQEENSRLGSQLSAQESVLEGLRGERQLWGRELAQQGAELAQDRGRMEAQIEALSHESASLQEDLQHARDSVRVKEKVVADQQASISQLREALAAREREGEEVRQDWEREQQSLQLQLEQETETSSHLQEELSAAVERKAQLKEELSSVREELAQWKTKYSKLRGEWEERMKVIGSLEESLAQVRDTFSQREAAIIRDRDEAAQRASTAEGRLRENEEAHRKQLEAKQTSHDNQLTILVQQKDQEIEEANQKVSTVEGEMRELLVEVTREKQAMESRVQRMSLALQQLQQDFTR
jgi:leucine-rich repeat/coiled-coil domain-containing protein 1